MADNKAQKSPPGSKPASPQAASPQAASPQAASPQAAAPQAASPEPAAPNDGGILPAHHWTQNPAEYDDAESALEQSVSSSTASVSSSILNYRTLHGRRYHSEIGNASYWGTNDEQQTEAMDVNHHALTLGIGGKLFLAPLEKDKIKRVLDVGTGTGIWAIDFADDFPEAEVTGTDISPIQPTWTPPNLKFEIEDYTREWTFSPNTFDFIHLRWLTGSIPDWNAFYEEAFKATAPGGWVQSCEPSSIVRSDHVTITDESPLGQWGKFFEEGGKKIGRSFKAVEENLARKAMEAAGFVDIEEYSYKTPIGAWAKDPRLKELGMLQMVALESDIEGYILFIANTLGWKREEIQVYIAFLRRDMLSLKFNPYFWQKVVWGRKPE